MKNLLFIIILFVFSACSKNENDPELVAFKTCKEYVSTNGVTFQYLNHYHDEYIFCVMDSKIINDLSSMPLPLYNVRNTSVLYYIVTSDNIEITFFSNSYSKRYVFE